MPFVINQPTDMRTGLPTRNCAECKNRQCCNAGIVTNREEDLAPFGMELDENGCVKLDSDGEPVALVGGPTPVPPSEATFAPFGDEIENAAREGRKENSYDVPESELGLADW